MPTCLSRGSSWFIIQWQEKYWVRRWPLWRLILVLMRWSPGNNIAFLLFFSVYSVLTWDPFNTGSAVFQWGKQIKNCRGFKQRTLSCQVCSLINFEQKEAQPAAKATQLRIYDLRATPTTTQRVSKGENNSFFSSLNWHRKFSSWASKVCCSRVAAGNKWWIAWVYLSCSSARPLLRRLFPQTLTANLVLVEWSGSDLIQRWSRPVTADRSQDRTALNEQDDNRVPWKTNFMFIRSSSPIGLCECNWSFNEGAHCDLFTEGWEIFPLLCHYY